MSNHLNTANTEIGEKGGFPPLYIHAADIVAPQRSFTTLLEAADAYTGDRFSCIEPDYTKYIDPKLIRRMSRIIKMGVAAAMECLNAAGETMPDAIVTGTAYGCLADTEQFLTRMVEFKEELLSPTAFIQSTHNTVGAQIALQLKCHNYNNTFVHRGTSFEAALMDAIALIYEGDAGKVLVGAVDEIIAKSHTILKRFGLYKEDGDSATLMNSGTKGTLAGEGAAFFLLGAEKKQRTLARLDAVKSFYKPEKNAEILITDFLGSNGCTPEDIDLVLLGNNGDVRYDRHYEQLAAGIFSGNNRSTYKQYCGEYPTSSAFALWLAAQIVHTGKVPGNRSAPAPERVLIYNNYKQSYPSLYLLSAC